MQGTKLWNRSLFIIIMIIMGACAGAVVWAFLFVMEFTLELIWITLPQYLDFAFLPLIICSVGGIIIGLHHKYFGDYPESLDTVLGKVKEHGRYEYHNIGSYTLAALLPLIFGGSIGPEAGITGTIAGLCTWVGDRMKRFGADVQNMTQVGIAAALSAIFTAPLFGFAAPMIGSTTGDLSSKNEEGATFVLPKNWKIIVYLFAIGGAMGIIFLLNSLVGHESGLPHFSEIAVGSTELIWLIPLVLTGSLAGWLYHAFEAGSFAINARLGDRPVIKALLGGIVLSLIGIALPYTMFSGEAQTMELAHAWTGFGAATLFLTGFLKLLSTSYCIQSGWKGGHFFPAIFSGVAIGLGFASISGADPVFCMCVCAGALVGCLTKQPILTVLLLFLCFPIKGVVVMIIAAAVGAAIPIPKRFQIKEH